MRFTATEFIIHSRIQGFVFILFENQSGLRLLCYAEAFFGGTIFLLNHE